MPEAIGGDLVYPLASMDQTLPATLLATGLFLGMLICLEIGRRAGLRRVHRGEDITKFGAVEGALSAFDQVLIDLRESMK